VLRDDGTPRASLPADSDLPALMVEHRSSAQAFQRAEGKVNTLLDAAPPGNGGASFRHALAALTERSFELVLWEPLGKDGDQLAQERFTALKENPLGFRSQGVSGVRFASSRACPTAGDQPLALQRVQVRTDGVVRKAQFGRKFIDGAIATPEQ